MSLRINPRIPRAPERAHILPVMSTVSASSKHIRDLQPSQGVPVLHTPAQHMRDYAVTGRTPSQLQRRQARQEGRAIAPRKQRVEESVADL